MNGLEPDQPRDRDQRRPHLAISIGEAVLRPLKTSEIIARDIVRDIVTRRLAPGDALPGENAMLELYSVGRESLREALRLLEVQGLITIRRGANGGPVVGTVDPANLGRVASLYYHLAGATYRELVESWVLADAILAERAARNPDPEARTKAMEPYLEGTLVEVADPGVGEFVETHASFHTALASLVQNRVLEISFQTLGQIISRHLVAANDPRELRDMIERDHYGIARAVVAGHGVRAGQLMERHIANIAAQLEARLGHTFDDLIEWR
jgi:DNA-binding FadR family transcriptional regulator